MIIEQNIGSDEPATWGLEQVPSQGSVQEKLRTAAMPSAGLAAHRAQIWRRHVDEVFTGKAVRARLLRAIAMDDGPSQDPNGRDFGGGVSALRFTREVVGPDRAMLDATVTEWAASAARNFGRWIVDRPSGASNVRMQLVKDPASGKWSVSEMVSSSPDGSGP
jgi:hypothetical protein